MTRDGNTGSVTALCGASPCGSFCSLSSFPAGACCLLNIGTCDVRTRVSPLCVMTWVMPVAPVAADVRERELQRGDGVRDGRRELRVVGDEALRRRNGRGHAPVAVRDENEGILLLRGRAIHELGFDDREIGAVLLQILQRPHRFTRTRSGAARLRWWSPRGRLFSARTKISPGPVARPVRRGSRNSRSSGDLGVCDANILAWRVVCSNGRQ